MYVYDRLNVQKKKKTFLGPPKPVVVLGTFTLEILRYYRLIVTVRGVVVGIGVRCPRRYHSPVVRSLDDQPELGWFGK